MSVELENNSPLHQASQLDVTLLDQHTYKVLAQHAKSFHLAGLFLPKKNLIDASLLYTFCRLVDDISDEDFSNTPIEDLNRLEKELYSTDLARPLIQRILHLSDQKNISKQIYLDLIYGCKKDVNGQKITTLNDLIEYSYEVAGTVGLMMAKILGVKNKTALKFSIDAGIALQLTNISRDVLEDLERKRCYIPERWILGAGYSMQDFYSKNIHDDLITSYTKQLISLAETYYKSSYNGLSRIPFKSRLGICIALKLYRKIGRKLLRRGANPMLGRTQLNGIEKILGILAGLKLFLNPKVLGLIPAKRHKEHLHIAIQHRIKPYKLN